MPWAIQKLHFGRLYFHINMHVWSSSWCQLFQMRTCYWYQISNGRTSERYFLMTNLLPGEYWLLSLQTKQTWSLLLLWLNTTPVSIPASWKHVLTHRAIVLLVTGSCFPIHKRSKVVFSLPSFKALNSAGLCSYVCSSVWLTQPKNWERPLQVQ